MGATKNSSQSSRIILRTEPCRCGCKGKDPGHAASVKRVVHEIHEVSEEQSPWNKHTDQIQSRIAQRGWIKMPYGQVEVFRRVTEFNGRVSLASIWVKAPLS